MSALTFPPTVRALRVWTFGRTGFYLRRIATGRRMLRELAFLLASRGLR